MLLFKKIPVFFKIKSDLNNIAIFKAYIILVKKLFNTIIYYVFYIYKLLTKNTTV